MKELAILEKMVDTEDPKAGAVFEKMVQTDLVEFDAFMKEVYPSVKGVTDSEGEFFMVIYNHRNKGHVGTFVFQRGVGYFGGSRIGSENPMRKPGDPLLKDPFRYKAKANKE